MAAVNDRSDRTSQENQVLKNIVRPVPANLSKIINS